VLGDRGPTLPARDARPRGLVQMKEDGSSGVRQPLGSNEDLIQILKQSRPALEALFRRCGVGFADAEDILQDAVVVVLRRWEEIDDPRAFLLGVVKRQIFQLFRKRRAENHVQFDEMLLEEVGCCPQRAVEARQDARKLLATLPERSGRIVEMRYGEELASREIASLLHCSDNSIRMTASRSLRSLRLWAESMRHRR
jgi:RNA polymerase sigma factor (sigma-70 family)